MCLASPRGVTKRKQKAAVEPGRRLLGCFPPPSLSPLPPFEKKKKILPFIIRAAWKVEFSLSQFG